MSAAMLPAGPPRIEIDHDGGDAVLSQPMNSGQQGELWQTCEPAELRQLGADALAAAEWLEARR